MSTALQLILEKSALLASSPPQIFDFMLDWAKQGFGPTASMTFPPISILQDWASRISALQTLGSKSLQSEGWLRL